MGLRRYDTLTTFLPDLIWWQVVVIYEPVDPDLAQRYTNWLCYCHGNVLVCTVVEF